MNVSASERHRFQAHVAEVLGADDAALLMEMLPSPEWDISGLKTDVSALKSDVSELKSDVSVLKTDMHELKTDLREMRHEIRQDVRDLERRMTEHTDLRVKAAVGESTRLLFFTILMSQATLVGMVIAAVKL